MRVVMTRIIVGVLMTAVQSMAWEQWTERDLVMPDARAGHSMTSRHGLVYVFGGRNNNKEVSHRPMTFDLNIEFGQIEFTTYDGKEITNCTGQDNELCDRYPRIEIGEYKNDVWKYDLDRKINCMRNTTASNMTLCDEDGIDSYWVQLDQGLKYGGCIMAFGVELCTHPSERYNHASAMFHDRFMIVYGGYGPFCNDYCDDVWMFDTNTYFWSKIDYGSDDSNRPGKRWKASYTFYEQTLYMYGGHRKWQGDEEEEVEQDTATYVDESGYLDDLWKLNIGNDVSDISFTLRVHVGGSDINVDLLGTFRRE